MNAQTPSYVPTNGLVSYWGFNGNANDISGNGNNGTVAGATLTADRFGNANSAYNFNGTNNYIYNNNPVNLPLGGTSRTVSAWIKTNSTYWGRMVLNYGGAQSSLCEIGIGTNGGTNINTLYGFGGSVVIASNQWVHVVSTYDAATSTSKLFANGVLITTNTTATITPTTNGALWIGRGLFKAANDAYYWLGQLDDISIYNRALSTTEVQQLYTGSVTVDSSCPPLSGTLSNGLVAYYPFCGNANDASGNNNNGTVNGASLTTDRFGNANSAYNFNGTSNYIDLGINSAINSILGDFSISYWIKPESSGGCVLSSCSTSNVNGWRIISRIGGGAVSTDFLVTPTWQASVTPGNVINYSQWNHVLFTRNGTATKIYCNGLLVYTGTFSSANINNPANTITKIGCNFATGLGEFITGKIDDFAIYNRSLTTDEALALYGQNICYESVTVTDTLIINTGILSYNPITYNNTINIYPNPAKDHITIDCGTLANVVGYSIKIVNTLGQEVFNQPMNTQQYYIPLNSWSGQGIYFVNVIDAQGHTIDIKKIILQ